MNRPKRVLVVEDEAIVALDLQRCVIKCGYDLVGIAGSCIEAIRLAQETKPDIVLMDYHLNGDLNGATAARELSKKQVRIIFLSAYLDEVIKEANDVADVFLAKPVSRRDVAQALTERDRSL